MIVDRNTRRRMEKLQSAPRRGLFQGKPEGRYSKRALMRQHRGRTVPAPTDDMYGPRLQVREEPSVVYPAAFQPSRRGILAAFSAGVGVAAADKAIAGGKLRLHGQPVDNTPPPVEDFVVPTIVAGATAPGSWSDWTDLTTVDAGYVQQGSGFGATQPAKGVGWLVGQYEQIKPSDGKIYVGVFGAKGSSVSHLRSTGDDVGIQYVDFYCNNGSRYRQDTLKQHPVSGVWGWWVAVDPNVTTGGTTADIEIRAVVVPYVGMPYALQGTPSSSSPYSYQQRWWSLFWYVDGANSLPRPIYYIDTRTSGGVGSDSNDGLTWSTPVLTFERIESLLATAQGVSTSSVDWSDVRIRYREGPQKFGAADGSTRTTPRTVNKGWLIAEGAPENLTATDFKTRAHSSASGGYMAKKVWVRNANHTGHMRMTNSRTDLTAVSKTSMRRTNIMSDGGTAVSGSGSPVNGQDYKDHTTDSNLPVGPKFWQAESFCDSGDNFDETFNCDIQRRKGTGFGTPTLGVLTVVHQMGSDGDLMNNVKTVYGCWFKDQQASTSAVHVDGIQWKLGVGAFSVAFQRIGDRSLTTELYQVQGLFWDSGGLVGHGSIYKPDLSGTSDGTLLGGFKAPTNLTIVLDREVSGAMDVWGTSIDAVDSFLIVTVSGSNVRNLGALRFGWKYIVPETVNEPNVTRPTSIHPLVAVTSGLFTNWAVLLDATRDELQEEHLPGAGAPQLDNIIDAAYVGELQTSLPNDPLVCLYDGTTASKVLFSVHIPNHNMYPGCLFHLDGVDETGDPFSKVVATNGTPANLSIEWTVAAVIDADHVKIDMTNWSKWSGTAGHETDPLGGSLCTWALSRKEHTKMTAGGTSSFEYAGPERYAAIGPNGSPGYRFKRTPAAAGFSQAVTCIAPRLDGRLAGSTTKNNSAVEVWLLVKNLETTSDATGNVIYSFGSGSSSGQFKILTQNGAGANTGKRTIKLTVGSGGSTKSTPECPVPFEGEWCIVHAFWDPVNTILSLGCWNANTGNDTWANDSTRYAVPTTQPPTVAHGTTSGNRHMWGGICTSNTGNLWTGVGVVLGMRTVNDSWTDRQAIWTQLKNLATNGAYASNDNRFFQPKVLAA